MFPEVVKAISQAYLVTKDSCPYAETLVITNQSQIVDSEECPPIESTELNSVDWALEQSKDMTLSRVIYLLKNGYTHGTVFESTAYLKFAKLQYVSSGFRCRVIAGSLMRLY